MKALILVDVQNDFLPGGSLAVPNGDEIVSVLNKIQPSFDLVVATQDWHPANHKSFASNHDEKSPFEVVEFNGLEQTLWPDHCIQGSKGAEFPVGLEMNKTEAIFRKGTDPEIDSYSGFYDNRCLKSTGLADYLRGKNVQQVYLTGRAGDICVYYTGLDSLRINFETYIIEDAVKPLTYGSFQRSMEHFCARGGKLIQSIDL